MHLCPQRNTTVETPPPAWPAGYRHALPVLTVVCSRGGKMVSWRRLARVGLAASVLAGCSVMPVSGPESWDVKSGQYDPDSLNYGLVRVIPKSIEVLAAHAPRIAGEVADQRGPQS